MEVSTKTHPEYSAQGLVEIVNDLIDTKTMKILNLHQKKRRLVEFNEEIDSDSDGKASFRELYEYLDPQNFRLASKEVNDIMMLTDADNDGKLSLEELLERDWLLARSSLLSARSGLHDEM